MPKNKKNKRKNHKSKDAPKRDLVFKNFQEEYAIVTKKLGDRRMLVKMPDMNKETMAIIPGRFRKRCWFDVGDLCLVSFREYQDTKVDIVYKYTTDERRALCRVGEIPPIFANSSVDAEANPEEENEEDAFEFAFDEI